ncbi:hypothetical protein JNJ66_05465 [Candidatus Saccharibacteria bacterium]|nr:hypothetical protein [Candidatus Saccharibacteria bacterium]
MELLKTSRRANDFGDVLHIAAQVAFVGLIGALVLIFQLPAVAFLLAIVSKWRIFAVRPRYWRANLTTNLVDLLFLVGVTALIIKPWVIPISATNHELQTSSQAASLLWLAVLAVWQIWLKPRTTQTMVLLQAGVAQFVAIVALCTYAGMTPELNTINQLVFMMLVAGTWLIAYASARHAISSYEAEPKISFLAQLWGFLMASLAWLYGHWMHVYIITPDLQIPQFALIVLLLSFCAIRAYGFQRHLNNDKAIARVKTRQSLRDLYVAAIFTGIFLFVVIASTRWSVAL